MSDSTSTPWTSRHLPLGPWLFVAMALNLAALPACSLVSDMACWAGWATHLQAHGYANYPANYPPIYIHWLWVIAQFYKLSNIPLASGPLLKLLVLTPVFAAHLGLLAILHRILMRTGAETRHWVLVMGAAALNPAIYMNGPVWGQVDLLFSLPVALALAGLFEGFLLRWVLPLLAVAFLLKFQAVAAAPAFVGLLWIRRKKIAWGLVPALFVILISIQPFLAAGSFGRMIHGAYLSSVSSYPLATYNAANLWFLLGFNTLPDTLFLFDPARDAKGLELLLTPRYLGWLLYSAFATWIVVDSLRHRENTRWWRNGVLAILGFFLVLPSMHERYLFLAVPIALVASAYHPRFLAIAGFVSFFNLFDTIWMMPPRGGILGHALAASTLIFALGILFKDVILSDKILAWADRTLPLWIGASVLLWTAVAADTTGELLRLERTKMLPPGWIKATEIDGRTAQQPWGSLQIDQSSDGGFLSVGGNTYAFGFGIHATSLITIPVPARARSFHAKVGVDDEAKSGHVEFEVVVDGASVWKSGPVDGGQKAREFLTPLNGAKLLELKVDALGALDYDHADWLEPVFEVPP